jgi:hypothetical protein
MLLCTARRAARQAVLCPSIAIARIGGIHERVVSAAGRPNTPRHRAMTGTTTWLPNRYPATRRGDHVDVYKSAAHGEARRKKSGHLFVLTDGWCAQVRVPDPYQWLEEPSAETDEWVTAQERFASEHLGTLPDRQRLEDGIRANMDYPRVRDILVIIHSRVIANVSCSFQHRR